MHQGIAYWIERWSKFQPDKLAVVSDAGSLTYRQLNDRANAICACLQGRGLEPGDRAALMMNNHPDFLVAFWAIVKVGAVFVPISPRLSDDEASYIVGAAKPRFVLTSSDLVEHATAVAAANTSEVLVVSELDTTRQDIEALHVDSPLESALAILFTSGTTGRPKGAVISHQAVMFTTLNYIINLRMNSDDVHLVTLPLSYTGGLITSTMVAFHTGATIVLETKFDAARALALVQQHSVTVMMGVPTMYRMMSNEPGFADADLSSLRLASAGGAPTPLDLAEEYFNKGVDIVHPYGITEAAGFNLYLDPADSAAHKGSLGTPTLYADAQIFDDDDRPLPPNEVGELVISGPMLMNEYLDDEAATREALRGGWLHTGDQGYRDEQGYFFLVGRKKDMIISGGFNVYPVEVENVITELPWVDECAVVGKSDPHWGEVVVAFVATTEPGHTADEVTAQCRDHVSDYKVPKLVEFVDALPKGVSGKVLKSELRGRLRDQ